MSLLGLPPVRRIVHHQPETLPVEEYCFCYRAVTEALSDDGTPFVEVMRSAVRALGYLPPRAATRLEFLAGEGQLSGFDPDTDASFELTAAGAPTDQPQFLSVRYGPGACDPAAIRISPGPVILELENVTDRRGVIGILQVPPGYSHTPLRFAPFLSGKDVLHCGTFRSLFRSELIPQTEGIGVKDVIILFTDLAGSTALYDRVGDLNAFDLVQQHFQVLDSLTVAHGGVVVKTIGDAVMAAFSTPDAAVRAAVAMLRETERLNAGPYGRVIVLKIGLHRGAAIAVTLNDRLDYFGQTVNIAARIQQMAEPDEICLTAAIHDHPGVGALLEGFRVLPQSSRVRGMEQPLRCFRAARPRPA